MSRGESDCPGTPAKKLKKWGVWLSYQHLCFVSCARSDISGRDQEQTHICWNCDGVSSSACIQSHVFKSNRSSGVMPVACCMSDELMQGMFGTLTFEGEPPPCESLFLAT